jgi:hypothetical protein
MELEHYEHLIFFGKSQHKMVHVKKIILLILAIIAWSWVRDRLFLSHSTIRTSVSLHRKTSLSGMYSANTIVEYYFHDWKEITSTTGCSSCNTYHSSKTLAGIHHSESWVHPFQASPSIRSAFSFTKPSFPPKIGHYNVTLLIPNTLRKDWKRKRRLFSKIWLLITFFSMAL